MSRDRDRMVWIVAQRYQSFEAPGLPFSWHRNAEDAANDLARRIEASPRNTFIFLSFSVDEPSVDYGSDAAVSAWLSDCDPWDLP